jgi:GntR family transcriptional regulator
MKIELNERMNIPLQQQILSIFKQKILSGELTPDQQLPSIRTFAKDNRISVITVQKAYELLEQEGLIYIIRSKGFYVKSMDSEERKIIAVENFKKEFLPLMNKTISEGLEFSEIINLVSQLTNEKKVK